MAQTFVWKPSTVNSWKGGIAFLADSSGPTSSPVITAPNGKTYTGKFVNTKEGRHQWLFPSELVQMPGLKVSYGGQTGTIPNPALSYEGSGLGSWEARSKGSLGDTSGGIGGVPAGFNPSIAGQSGAIPAYIGGGFPSPAFANFLPATYSPITAAAYNFTDPIKYAKQFGAFNRKEIQKNYDLSKQLSSDALDTELSYLQHYVPAASAIKRQELSADNQFNQSERTKQINNVLPEAQGDFNDVRSSIQGQRARATTFAEGRVPDSIGDRAYELGVRSASADASAAGGFGANSSVARKASDLLSTTQRINLSQYGDRALTQGNSALLANLGAKASLYLAPTEYSNAGSQVNVMPSLSPTQLINSNLNAINGLTTIAPTTGLQSTTQQNQFSTGLNQQTNQFNASNALQNSQFNSTGAFQASQFNANAQNTFSLDKFGYNASYANSVAGGVQTDINTQIALQQQQQFAQLMQQYQQLTQNAGSANSGGLLGGVLGGSGILGQLGGLVGGGKGGSTGGGGGGGKGSSIGETFGQIGSNANGSPITGPLS